MTNLPTEFDTRKRNDDSFTSTKTHGNTSNNNNVAAQRGSIRTGSELSDGDTDGFLRKVYANFTTQLAMMVAVATAIFSRDDIIEYLHTNPHASLVMNMVAAIGSLTALMFKILETPNNFALLTIYTLVESYIVGFVVSLIFFSCVYAVTMYPVVVVLQALMLTLAAFVALTLYAKTLRRDLTRMSTASSMGLLVLIFPYAIMIAFSKPTFEFYLLNVYAAALFCALIVMDTQMIMSKVSIVAVDVLYLDVVNLFLHILRIFGDRRQ